MKKALTILLAVLLVATMALGLAACSPCNIGLHDWNEGSAIITTPATCEQEGEKTVTCNLCGVSTTEVIPKTDHNYGELVAAVTPTDCSQDGTRAHYQCSVCHKYFDENKVEVSEADLTAPAHHNFGEWHEATTDQSDCMHKGTVGYKQCQSCKKYFDVDGKELDTIYTDYGPHIWDEEVAAKAPTCVVDGNIAYKHCKICNKYYDEDETELGVDEWIVKANGRHTLGELIAQVEATCEQAGKMAHYHCSVCGKDFADEQGVTELESLIIPALGHTWNLPNEGVWTWATNHSSATLHLVCATNGAHTTQVVFTGDEVDVDDEQGPTCTEDGKVVYSVTVTKQALAEKLSSGKLSDGIAATLTTSDEVTSSKLGHNYEGQDWIPDGEGNHYKLCANDCGTHGETEECTTQFAWDDEQHYQQCSICQGKTEVESHDPTEVDNDETGHWFVCAKVGCNAQAGYEKHEYTAYNSDEHDHWDVCEGCNYEDKEHKTAHEITWIADASTHEGECDVCERPFEEASHQTEGNHHEAEPSTSCLETGKLAYDYCEVCKYYIVNGEAVESIGDLSDGTYGEHKLNHIEGREASCTEEGAVDHWHCSVCNKNFTTQQATDEVEGEVVIGKVAHQTSWTHEGDAFGQHHQVCTVCNQTLIEAESCQITSSTVDNKCDRCGHVYTDKEILDALYELASNKTLGENTFVLTGTVTEVESNSFTMSVNDGEESRSVYVYRPSGSGNNAFSKVIVGATVTVSGRLKNYDGKREFDNCSIKNIVLPDFTVTVDSSWEDNDAITNVTVSGGNNTFQAGSTVEITVEAKEDYLVSVVVTLNVGGGTLAVTQDGNKYSFVITGDVTVTITAQSTAGWKTITIVSSDINYSGSSYQSNKFTMGEFEFSYDNLIANGNNQIQWIKNGKDGKVSTLKNTTAIIVNVLSVKLYTTSSVSFTVEFATQADFSDAQSVPATYANGVAIADSPIENALYIRITNMDGTAYVTSIEITYQSCLHANPEQHPATESDCKTHGYEQYWSCPTCGKLFSDEDCTREIKEPVEKELGAHTWAVDTTVGDGWTWNLDGEQKTATVALKCSVCEQTTSETVEVSYRVDKTASCTEQGKGVYTAVVKKDNLDVTKEKEITLETVAHTLGDLVNTDSTGHYNKCSVCGNEMKETREEHKYSTYTSVDGNNHKSTCQCGYENTTPHTWAEKPSQIDGDDAHHHTLCTANGCDANTGYDVHDYGPDKEFCECGARYQHTHQWSEDWSKDADGHWHACTNGDCNDRQPDVDSTHTFEWKVTEDGSKHQEVCSICQYAKVDSQDDHQEKVEQISGDSTYHRVVCEICHYVIDANEKHTGEWREIGDGCHEVCTVCEYEINAEQDHELPDDVGLYEDNEDGTHSTLCVNCTANIEHNTDFVLTEGDESTHDMSCSVVGCYYAETKSHEYGDWSKKDEEQHSRSCEYCEHEDTQNHVWTGELTNPNPNTNKHTVACSVEGCDATTTQLHDFGTAESRKDCACGEKWCIVDNSDTLELTSSKLGLGSYNTEEKTVSVESNGKVGVTIAYYQFMNGSGNVLQMNSTKGTGSYLKNTTALSGRIVNFTINFSQTGSKDKGAKLTLTTLDGQSIEVDVSNKLTSFTWKPSAGQNGEYVYFELKATDGASYMSSITIEYSTTADAHIWQRSEGLDEAPTCTEAGKIGYICARCGETKLEIDEQQPATGHTWEVDTTNGDGWTWDVKDGVGTVTVALKCHCGATHDESLTIVADEHYQVFSNSTCDVQGSGKYTVTITYEGQSFNGEKVEYFELAPHTNEGAWNMGTDGHEGFHYQECSVCQKEEGRKYEPCNTETWDSDDDKHWKICSVCGYNHGKTAEAGEHSYDETTNLCKCGKKNPAHQHNYGEEIPAVNATCTSDGNVAYYKCSGCQLYFVDVDGEMVEKDYETQIVIKAYGHEVENAVLEDVGDKTNHGKKCTRCQEYIDQAPHGFIVTRDNTQTSTAIHTKTCDCGFSLEENHYFGADNKQNCECGELRYNVTKDEGSVKFDAANLASGAQPTTEKVGTTPAEFTLVFDKGTGNTTPTVYDQNGRHVRLYGGGTLTISAPSTYKIVAIVLTFSSGEGSNTITADSGTLSGNSWTGSATSVKFTVGGTSGHRRFATVTISYISESKECNHYWEVQSRVESNCVTDQQGSITYKCDRCGNTKTDVLEITHKIVEVVGQEATCTQQGWATHYECSDCHKWFSDESGSQVVDSAIQDKLQHKLEWRNGEGQHWQECTLDNDDCDYEPQKEAHQETYGSNDDEHWLKCDTCGWVSSDKQGHNYTEQDDKCVCGAINPEKHTHSYLKNKWDGNDEQHWRVCDDGDYADMSTAVSHDNFNYNSNDDGQHSATCTTCNHSSNQDHTLKYTNTTGDTVKHHVSCELCNWDGRDEDHTIASRDKKDANEHNATCNVCNTTFAQAHDFGDSGECACGEKEVKKSEQKLFEVLPTTFTGNSYANCNGDYTFNSTYGTYVITSYQVMNQSSKIQFQKNAGYISITAKLSKIVLTSPSGTFTVNNATGSNGVWTCNDPDAEITYKISIGNAVGTTTKIEFYGIV